MDKDTGDTGAFYIEGDEVEVKTFGSQRGTVVTAEWSASLGMNAYGIDLDDGTYVTGLTDEDLVLLKSSPAFKPSPWPKANAPYSEGGYGFAIHENPGSYESGQGGGWYDRYSDKTQTAFPYAGKGSGASKSTYTYTVHKHLRTPLTVPTLGKVYLGSHHTDDKEHKTAKPLPDVRVILDHMRLPKGWMGGAGTDITLDGFSTISVIWPDFGAIPVTHLDFVVDHIMDLVRDGKIVEIGCHGGHGRTGSLAAGLLIKASSFTAKGAVKRVRSAYCDRAIESKTQETMLEEYATFLRNEMEG
jgi:hypothetical protein